MAELQQRRKREGRSLTWVKAVIDGGSRTGVPAFITNVSNAGCRLKCDDAFGVGEIIRITMPRLGAVSARICWSDSGHSGAQFIAGSDAWISADDAPEDFHLRQA